VKGRRGQPRNLLTDLFLSRLKNIFTGRPKGIQDRSIKVNVSTGYGPDGRDSIPFEDKRFSSLYTVQTGSGAHTTSYPVGLYGKLAEA
jgi:hypothetical protein